MPMQKNSDPGVNGAEEGLRMRKLRSVQHLFAQEGSDSYGCIEKDEWSYWREVHVELLAFDRANSG